MAASRKQLRKVCFCPEHKLRLKTSKKVCFAELKNVSFLPKYQRICTAERGKSDVEQKSWALKKSVQAKKNQILWLCLLSNSEGQNKLRSSQFGLLNRNVLERHLLGPRETYVANPISVKSCVSALKNKPAPCVKT
jgi:hypothetical protein